ncbi:hypothetical protein JW962_03735 [Candidatus Dojkabacteria bacterium]|nr:hypothetical protein [Candidatus Dojkabacteria bacterium]
MDNLSKVISTIGKITVDQGITDPNEFVRKAITIAVSVAGIVALVYVVLGGYKFLISSGDSNKYQEAIQTIMYAVVGLVVVAMSGLVINYVGKVLGLKNLFDLSSLLN